MPGIGIGIGIGKRRDGGSGGVPADAAPTVLTAGSFTGTSAVGQTLVGVLTLYNGYPTVTVESQWFTDGTLATPIPGEVGPDLILTEAMVGYTPTRVDYGSNIAGGPIAQTAGTASAVAAIAPSAYDASMWTLADAPSIGGDTLRIVRVGSPATGGITPTMVQYKVGAGAWTDLSATLIGSDNITVTALTPASVMLRIKNATFNGPDGDSQTVTPSATATAPDAFTAPQISAVDMPSAGSNTGAFVITTAPFDGGSPLTLLEWQLSADDGVTFGSVQSTAWAGTGTYQFTTLASTATVPQVWARNAIGAAVPLILPAFTPTFGNPVKPALTATGLNPPGWSSTRDSTGTSTYDASVLFDATAGEYWISMPSEGHGVTINSTTGLLTHTKSQGVLGAQYVIVWKENDHGNVDARPITLTVSSPATLTATQRWRSQTAAGEGRLDTSKLPGGAIADGVYAGAWGSFTVTGGFMSPTAATSLVASGSPYTIGGKSFYIDALGFTVSTIAQMKARGGSGITLAIRGPTAGGTLSTIVTADLTSWATGFTSECILAAADPWDMVTSRTTSNNFAITGCKFLTFDGWSFRAVTTYAPKHTINPGITTRFALGIVSGCQDIKLLNCQFSSNMPIARQAGERPVHGVCGLYLRGVDRLLVQDCIVTHTWFGVLTSDATSCFNVTVDRCDIVHSFVDGFNLGGADTATKLSNTTVTNCFIGHGIGDNGYHMDGIQNAPVGAAQGLDCSGFRFEGNIIVMGPEQLLGPAWPSIGASNGYPALPGSKGAPITSLTWSNTVDASQHKDFDATAGAQTIQMLACTVKTTYGFQKWGRSANPVTILPPAGTQFRLGGVLYNSLALVDDWEFIRVLINNSGSIHDCVMQGNAMQGIFENPPGFNGPVNGVFINPIIRNNIVCTNVNPLAWGNSTTPYMVNNTAIPSMPGRLTRSQRQNPISAGFDSSNSFFSANGGSGNVTAGNVGGPMNIGGVAEGANGANFQMWTSPGGKTIANVSTYFTPITLHSSQTAQNIPMTRADAVALARPKAGTSLSDIGMGAKLAVSSADDGWDFITTPGRIGTGPWHVQLARPTAFVAATGGGTITWGAPAEPPTGTLTYDLRHKLNGGGYTTVSPATSPYTITGQASGDLVVEIRAVDSIDGAGQWLVRPAVAITGTGDTAPAVNVAGSISGNAWIGQTLTSTAATFTGSPAPTVTRQWYRFTSAGETDPANGTAISGATGATYVVQTADDGTFVRCRTIGTNTASVAYDMSGATVQIGIASLAASINADGWSATVTSPGTYDPQAPELFTVFTAGHDALGNAVTFQEKIGKTAIIRNPYPLQATPTTTQVALSNYVYSGDSIVGGVTNNSTRAAPKPIACWINHDRDVATSSVYTVKLAVAHGHARGGRPVAAVTFSITDGTTTVTQTVTTPTVTGFYVSGLAAPCFAADMDISTLTQGAMLTVDAVIKPWRGAAFTISTDADTYPSPNLTTFQVLNDRLGTYGTVYAYMSAAGNDGTGVASANAATAAASPFLAGPAALAAMQTVMNSTYGRNNVSNGRLRIIGTRFLFSAASVTTDAATVPLIVEADNPANKATTFLDNTAGDLRGFMVGLVKFQNLTIRLQQNGDKYSIDNGAATNTYTTKMVFENVSFDRNAKTVNNALIHKAGDVRMINCDSIGGDAGQATGNLTSVNKAITAIGCNGLFTGANTFNAIACRATAIASGAGISVGGQAATATRVASVGGFFGFNWITIPVDGDRAVSSSMVIGARGLAVVGSTFEQTGGVTNALVWINADTNANAMENVVFCQNTVVGSRVNFGYQDTGSTTVAKSGYVFHNVVDQRNTKNDVFGTNANLVGNWPISYQVGARYNCAIRGDNNGGGVGAGNWLGEIKAIGDVNGTQASASAVAWTNDQSFRGGGAGGGDYTPTAGSTIPKFAAGLAPYHVDLKATPIDNTGAGWSGAEQ